MSFFKLREKSRRQYHGQAIDKWQQIPRERQRNIFKVSVTFPDHFKNCYSLLADVRREKVAPAALAELCFFCWGRTSQFRQCECSRHFSLWSSYLCALVVRLQRADKAVNCLDIEPRSFLCTSNYAGYIKPLTLCQHCFLLNLSGEHSYHRCGLVSNACLLRCT